MSTTSSFSSPSAARPSPTSPPTPRPDLRSIAVFGSTGSIGTATLDVMRCLARSDPAWKVTALSTHSRVTDLVAQVEEFKPRFAVVTGPEPAAEHRARIRAAGTELLLGPSALAHVAGDASSGTVVGSIVGAAGLPAVVEAVRRGKRVALANKESLVVAGAVVMPLARATGSEILPVDSEHSAIFQAMACGRRQDVRRVILTASGGPFRTASAADIDNATVEQALNHPTWRMGGKITIDSATLFNKAFELIEARWLFDLHAHEIDVVVHPQSVVHSMVEFVDGSTLAQLSPPDMKLPIQYALTWPARSPCPGDGGRGVDWTRAHSLTFEPPDRTRFPSIDIAYEVVKSSDLTLGAVVNAANEVAVGAFLAGRCRFGAITRTVRTVLDRHLASASPLKAPPLDGATQATFDTLLDGLIDADRRARDETQYLLAALR